MAFDGFELFEPQVELLGRHLATIENHCGIVEYDETVLRVKCRRCEVRIEGEGLHLTALTPVSYTHLTLPTKLEV